MHQVTIVSHFQLHCVKFSCLQMFTELVETH